MIQMALLSDAIELEVGPGLKVCLMCKATKPLDEFHPYRRNGRKETRQTYCKTCSSDRCRSYKFGDEALRRAKEATHCEACGDELGERWDRHIDHDHATNAFRGILCRPCNLALGLQQDNAERLRLLADYIERVAS